MWSVIAAIGTAALNPRRSLLGYPADLRRGPDAPGSNSCRRFFSERLFKQHANLIEGIGWRPVLQLENLLAVVSKQFCTRRCRQQKARKSVHVDGRPYGLRALPPENSIASNVMPANGSLPPNAWFTRVRKSRSRLTRASKRVLLVLPSTGLLPFQHVAQLFNPRI